MAQREPYPNLTPRQQTIFQRLVEEHVLSTRAIGSRQLLESTRLSLSPATIRNEMSALEEMGLLTQPYTSAGRIPTDLGYGYYVDSLMREAKLPMNDRKAILDALNESPSRDLEEILSRVSIALSRVTTLISVILSPRLSEGTLHKIDLVRLASDRILIVLTLKTGFVRSIILEINAEIGDEDLQKSSSFLNERLCGVKLQDLKNQIDERLQDSDRKLDARLIDLVIDSAYELFTSQQVEIHLGETRHVFDQPEFSDIGVMRSLFELIEDRVEVMDLFKGGDHSPSKGIRIAIGQELASERLQICSVVTSRYRFGESEGNIGVIGPKRMNYSRLVSLVNFTSTAIHLKLEE